MKNTKYIFLILALLSLDSCISLLSSDIEKDATCYWMENYSGKFEWVATEVALGLKYDKQECFNADSCDGGLGESNGGCYKWAKTANSPRFEWDRVEKSSEK